MVRSSGWCVRKPRGYERKGGDRDESGGYDAPDSTTGVRYIPAICGGGGVRVEQRIPAICGGGGFRAEQHRNKDGEETGGHDAQNDRSDPASPPSDGCCDSAVGGGEVRIEHGVSEHAAGNGDHGPEGSACLPLQSER